VSKILTTEEILNIERPLSSEMQAESLTAWEFSFIEFFAHAANLIGLPKSIGEIYGLLFCASAALNLDDLQRRLNISRGSASQGLKLLRQLGAVQVKTVKGSKKDHYLPELSMKRLVAGFIRDQFGPHLESGSPKLNKIEALIENEANLERRLHGIQRLRTLRIWQKGLQKLLPLILVGLGGGSLKAADSTRPLI